MARENDADWHAKKGENQMKKILDIITDEMKKAFAANGYDENFANALQQLKDAGLDAVIEEYQRQFSAWYAAK